MKLSSKRLIEDELCAEAPVLGALFTSFTFDPLYFEDQVLRAILRLESDPQEDPARYFEEARRAIQETPIACIVDATVRGAGQRFPYELHVVRKPTFHPKVYLVLFENEARLAVGSGNLTRYGIEQNTELFFTRRLRYDTLEDAALLSDVAHFFSQCAALSSAPPRQLNLALNVLSNRLPSKLPEDIVSDVRFVSSFDGALAGLLASVIPADAKIQRVGVLAPFFEQDDFAIVEEDGLPGVVGKLLEMRPSANAEVDVGVPWDDAPVSSATAEPNVTLATGTGRLWAWKRKTSVGDQKIERLDYFFVESLASVRVKATDAAGNGCSLERAQLQSEADAGRFFPCKQPTVLAPQNILRTLASQRSLHLWLHPATTIDGAGLAARRALHAKAVVVTISRRGKTDTFALLGSANASNAALSRSVSQLGNVEACVLCRFEGEVRLHDLLPTLVRAPIDTVDLVERDYPKPVPDPSAWIEEVVHDAKASTLTVRWKRDVPGPTRRWALLYMDRTIISAADVPEEDTVVAGFALSPRCCEVTLRSGELTWPIPIRVLDVAELPPGDDVPPPTLREILALLGRRLSRERLTVLHRERGASGVAATLEAVFGEGFGPTDVFKAWWGIAEDLRTAPSLASFRHRLHGSMGVRRVWEQLRIVDAEVLSPDEIWIYGCELMRELRAVTVGLPEGPDLGEKRQLLSKVLEELEQELRASSPSAHDSGWAGEVKRFYGLGGAHDAT